MIDPAELLLSARVAQAAYRDQSAHVPGLGEGERHEHDHTEWILFPAGDVVWLGIAGTDFDSGVDWRRDLRAARVQTNAFRGKVHAGAAAISKQVLPHLRLSLDEHLRAGRRVRATFHSWSCLLGPLLYPLAVPYTKWDRIYLHAPPRLGNAEFLAHYPCRDIVTACALDGDVFPHLPAASPWGYRQWPQLFTWRDDHTPQSAAWLTRLRWWAHQVTRSVREHKLAAYIATYEHYHQCAVAAHSLTETNPQERT